jgi:hypothetical protein
LAGGVTVGTGVKVAVGEGISVGRGVLEGVGVGTGTGGAHEAKTNRISNPILNNQAFFIDTSLLNTYGNKTF